MELGNAVFGNSRGEHHVSRDLQNQFYDLLVALGFDGRGNPEESNTWPEVLRGRSNGVFIVRLYCWGDCDCGAESPVHLPTCEITLKHDQWISDRFDYAARDDGILVMSRESTMKMNDFEAAHPYPKCTCGAAENWVQRDEHLPTCSPTLANFEHLPSGFQLDWYKYPLRDSYSNQPLTSQMIAAWMPGGQP